MSTWLESINKQLDEIKIKDITQPKSEVKEGEHVVGVADDDIRKLYYLLGKYETLSEEAHYGHIFLF